jgi:hypothetical protein
MPFDMHARALAPQAAEVSTEFETDFENRPAEIVVTALGTIIVVAVVSSMAVLMYLA